MHALVVCAHAYAHVHAHTPTDTHTHPQIHTHTHTGPFKFSSIDCFRLKFQIIIPSEKINKMKNKKKPKRVVEQANKILKKCY